MPDEVNEGIAQADGKLLYLFCRSVVKGEITIPTGMLLSLTEIEFLRLKSILLKMS